MKQIERDVYSVVFKVFVTSSYCRIFLSSSFLHFIFITSIYVVYNELLYVDKHARIKKIFNKFTPIFYRIHIMVNFIFLYLSFSSFILYSLLYHHIIKQLKTVSYWRPSSYDPDLVFLMIQQVFGFFHAVFF